MNNNNLSVSHNNSSFIVDQDFPIGSSNWTLAIGAKS